MLEFKVPELGDNIESAEVIKVLVAAGDRVQVEQPVLELETDKATFELPCSASGRVAEVLVRNGDTVHIGQPVLRLEEAADASEGAPAAGEEPAEEEPTEEEPTEEETAEEETAEEETAEEETAPGQRKQQTTGGKERPAKAAQRETSARASLGEQAARQAPGAAERKSPLRDIGAGPATRRLARELGVELEVIAAATGRDHLSQSDVKAFVRQLQEQRQVERAPEAPSAPSGGELPDFERWGAVERQHLNAVGRTAAVRLTEAWQQIPHVTQHEHADITQLEEARRRYQERRDKADPTITLTALVIKAAIAALKHHPRFNSSYDAKQQEVIVKRYYNIGVAVDTPEGLLVPVLHEADKRSIRQLARELSQLAERARQRKLSREELQGASFSVSNQGGIGGVLFTPIINPPEVAILGVSATRTELALDEEGEPRQRLLLPLSLSYDHRVNNGADAVRFMRTLARALEDPFHLLLES